LGITSIWDSKSNENKAEKTEIYFHLNLNILRVIIYHVNVNKPLFIVPKKEGISWRIDSKSVYLQQKRRCDFWGMFRFDRDTHQIILKTEIASLAHGGRHYRYTV